MIASSPPSVIVQAPSAAADQVIVAKANGDAILIWDAGSVVANILRDKTPIDAAMRSIESQAANLLFLKGSQLPNASSISLRVVYPRKPEFNPQYGVELSTTVERLMSLKTTPALLTQNGKTWAATINEGRSPRDLTVTVTGQLPQK